MEPYVVKGDRILPPPEEWRYVKVPALVLTRGDRVITTPGYELLSNLNSSQTRVLVEDLQLRQFASVTLWPMLTQVLPKMPVYVVVDINQQQSTMPLPIVTSSDVWEGEHIVSSATRSALGNNVVGFHDFSRVETPSFEAEYGLSETVTDDDDGAITLDEPDITAEDSSQMAEARMAAAPSVVKPLPDGFVDLAMNGGPLAALVRAGAPIAGAARPGEERLAATISYNLNLFALGSLSQKPPPWFARGLGNLLASTQVSHAQIDFAAALENFNRRRIPNLSTIFKKKEGDPFTTEESMLASAFVHYGLFGENGKYAARFMAFVDMLAAGEEPTPAMFRNVFGFWSGMTSMEAALATYTRNTAYYKSMQITGIPPMPAPTYREAVQSEVARIKSEVFVSQNNLAKALNELRIAYWRGEREPDMLAMLATLELQVGSEPRARNITKTLMAQPKPPPRACIAAAQLQFKDALAMKPAGAKLTAAETSELTGLLGGALAGGLTTEALCSTLANVVTHSSAAPDAGIAAFLQEAARRYPHNKTIAEAAAGATRILPAPSDQPS